MSKTILITGASGNIGSQLVKILEQTDNQVLKATQDKTTHGTNNQVYIDFADKNSLVEGFKKADVVFLLFPMVEQMVSFAENAVEAAKEANVKTLIRSSGAGADSNAQFLMPQVQGSIDDLIVNSGIPYVITQPASFMQNFVNFFAQNIKNGAVYLPVGTGKIGWVDVRDIAQVNATILANPSQFIGSKITITGSENLSYAQALKTIADTIGKEIQFVDVPEEAAINAMKEMGMPDFTIQMTSSLNQIIKAGYAEGTTETVKEITGKAPISFKQFSADYQEAWKS